MQYLLRQTYQVKPGEIILFHAAAGGVGSLACQWVKALGAKLIGTVSSPEKAAHAKALGAWETIDYSHEDVAKRVLELTDGKKCPVVYDGVGQDTWLTSLDCVAPRGLVVSFGNASGPVSGVNLGILAQKGSVYVTRPTLGSYANNAQNLQAMADELFDMLASGKPQGRWHSAVRPERRRQGADRAVGPAHHWLDHSDPFDRLPLNPRCVRQRQPARTICAVAISRITLGFRRPPRLPPRTPSICPRKYCSTRNLERAAGRPAGLAEVEINGPTSAHSSRTVG